MTQHITPILSASLAKKVDKDFAYTSTQERDTALCNAAIQSYIDSQEHIPKTDLENRIDAALDRLLPKSNADQLPPLPEPDRLTAGGAVPWHSDQLIQSYAIAYGDVRSAQTRSEVLTDAIETVKNIKLEHESDHSEGAGFNQGVDACIEALQGCQ